MSHLKPSSSWLTPRLAPGSLILISGVTGLVGAGQAKILLDLGYKIRGTTRSVAGASQLVQRFQSKYGNDFFQVVEVKDGTQEEAWIPAFQGVSGFIAVATDMSQFSGSDRTAREQIDGVVNMTLALLKAAAKTPTVQSGVLTSSSIAVHYAEEGVERTIDIKTTYNEDMASRALSAGKDDPLLGLYIYAANKVASDKAAFEYVKTQKPGYAFNVVAPDFVAGTIHNPDVSRRYSTGTMLQDYYLGKDKSLLVAVRVTNQYMSLDDVARIQAAALLQPDVDLERLWGVAGTFNLPQLQRAMQTFSRGTKEFADPDPVKRPYIAHIDNSRSLELLQRLGRSGFESIEDGVTAALSDVEQRSG